MVRLRKNGKTSLLASLNLFAGCSAKELAQIAGITYEVTAEAGRVLCAEGEPGQEFFVIVDGTVAVSIGGHPIVALGQGRFFGEMALLDGGPRIATVKATSPLDLLVLNRSEFETLLVTAPSVARRMLAALGTRLRAADKVMVSALPAGGDGAPIPIGI